MAAGGRLYRVEADALHGAPMRSLFLGLVVGFPMHPLHLHAAVQAMRAVWICQLRASKQERWRARVVPLVQEELIPKIGCRAE